MSPCSYHVLRHHAEYFGARVVELQADKAKRRVLMPLYALVLLAGKLWSRRLFFAAKYGEHRRRNEEIYRHINSAALLFGRSLVLVLEKEPTVAGAVAA
jgi:hypothetical protein